MHKGLAVLLGVRAATQRAAGLAHADEQTVRVGALAAAVAAQAGVAGTVSIETSMMMALKAAATAAEQRGTTAAAEFGWTQRNIGHPKPKHEKLSGHPLQQPAAYLACGAPPRGPAGDPPPPAPKQRDTRTKPI